MTPTVPMNSGDLIGLGLKRSMIRLIYVAMTISAMLTKAKL